MSDSPSAAPVRAETAGVLVVAIISVVALVFGLVALVDGGDGGGSADTQLTAASAPAVSLAEFSITPATITVGTGGSLDVTNDGSTPHNLAVKDQPSLTTPDLASGESATLDVSSLTPGSYTVICTIPGHEAAGMVATLEVTDDPGLAAPASGDEDADAGSHSGGHGSGDMTPAEWANLDKVMEDSIKEFPAETEGKGNQPLEPARIEADGTKVFELTAQLADWEVEPGKVVEAWTYNGMVPGPYIRLEVGDKVKMVIDNQLPLGTDVHWHGIRVPNSEDGVSPLTQELIPPGETYTYEFTASEQALGMYHPHHHSQFKIPNGMWGALQVGDAPLPAGRTISGKAIPADVQVTHEFPMVLNDAGVIGFSLNGKSFPATEPLVMKLGEWALIHYYNEGLTAHPMHLHGFPQLVVAKDGIALDQPYYSDTVNVAPGERYSVLFQATDPGAWVWHCHILTHAEADTGMFGMVTALIVE